LLGTEGGEIPEFGFRPRAPLVSDRVERTEVDMKLGGVLFEAKLTEGDFQVQKPELVERYCGFKEIFDSCGLPRKARKYVSYQLLRNVLAAYALEMSICVLLDARRPDLLELWYAVMRCVRITTLRTRCKVLTWQELADCLPPTLQEFLEMKYGIVSGGS